MSSTSKEKGVLPILKQTDLPKPSWAPISEDGISICYLSVVEDPDLLFLRLADFYDQMEKLSKDIQEYANQHQEHSANPCVLDVGDLCLGRCTEEDEWNRAVIKSKVSDDQFELFFVDFGDLATVSVNNVVPISGDLITKIPFQVIECYLAGIQFPQIQNEDWENDFIDQLFNLIGSVGDTGINLSVKVKVVGVEPEGRFSKGKRYKVVLFKTNGNENVNINNKLVEAGLVQRLEGEEHLLQNFVEEVDVIDVQPQVTYHQLGTNGTSHHLTVIDVGYNSFELVTSRQFP